MAAARRHGGAVGKPRSCGATEKASGVMIVRGSGVLLVLLSTATSVATLDARARSNNRASGAAHKAWRSR